LSFAEDSYGKVIKPLEKQEKPKDAVRMIAGSTDKKMVSTGEEENEQFVKHQSFENYLIEMKKRCAGKHLPH